MKNEELHQLIKALPENQKIDDYAGDFTAIIITDDHFFECEYIRHKDWFGKVSFTIEKGIIRDADEGKEIEITSFQSEMICELFRPLLYDAVEDGILA